MSAELGIIVGFLGGAFLLLKLAYQGGETETEDGPDGLKLFFIGIAWMFLLASIFAIQQIAGKIGYDGIRNVAYWLLRGGLFMFALVGAVLMWDFIKQAMDIAGIKNIDNWGGL